MDNHHSILSRLDKVRSTGRDKWTACCPAHDDKSPSLSVAIGRKGNTIFYCHSGCTQEEVRDALGINWGSAFVEGSAAPVKPREPDVDDYVIAIARASLSRGERLSREDAARFKQAKLSVARRQGCVR